MPHQHRVPDDPLGFIRKCVRDRSVLWTHHVSMRMRSRAIRRQAILDAVDDYEIIEAYPEDKYLPSYLVLARGDREIFHVLFATDAQGGNVRVITAYRPDPAEWLPDWRTRRARE